MTTIDPLAGLQVVELSGSVAGGWCSKLFADQGAHVMLVGDSELAWYQHAYLHERARPVAEGEIDWSRVHVVIESSAPEPLVPRSADRWRGLGLDLDRVVQVRLSPFAPDGLYASWLGGDLVDYALSGHAHLYGDPDREPLPGPPDQPAVAAGLFGFIGAMAALMTRDRFGWGQAVEINHHRVMVALHQITLERRLLTGDVLTRMGNRYTGQGQPNGPYRCLDGWVSIAAVTVPQIQGVLSVTGLTHLLDDPGIDSPQALQHDPARFDRLLGEWLAERTRDEVVELFQAMRVPACPLLAPHELLTDPQLIARRFLRPAVELDGSLVPASPIRRTRAPSHPNGPGARHADHFDASRPLAGVRVLDLTRVWAGPLCTRILAELGAEVVCVEAPWGRGPLQMPQSAVDATRYFPDDDPGERPWNRNGHFIKYALAKKSLAIDLQSPQGQAAFARIVPHFDVLVENFSSRVMPQLGFDQTRLHALNPNLIYVTMPGYGRSGPAEHWLAYGSSVDSHAGLSHLTGYPGQVPWKGGVAWPDPIAGLHACSALMASLWARAHGGGGATIEVAQFESTVAAIGGRVLAAQHGEHWSPGQGSFIDGCIGSGDAWLAVSIPDRSSAEAVVALAASWLEADFAGEPTARSALAELAVELGPAQAAARLQANGIAAAVAASADDVLADAHLHEVDAWVTVDQPDVGPFRTARMPIGLSHCPLVTPGPAPTLGEHNAEVLAACGFASAEIAELSAAGVIADRPPR